MPDRRPTPQELEEAKADLCGACFKTSDVEPVQVRRSREEGWVESSLRICANEECRNLRAGTDEDRLTFIKNQYEYKYFGDYELSPKQSTAVWEAYAFAARVPALRSENEKLKASLLEAVGALEPFAKFALATNLRAGRHVIGVNGERGKRDVYEDDFIAAAQVHARLSSSLEGGEGSGWLPIESAPDDFNETYFLVRPRGQHPARGTPFVPTVACRLGNELFTPTNHVEPLVWARGGDMFAGPTTDIREADLEWMPLPDGFKPLPPPPEHQAVGGE